MNAWSRTDRRLSRCRRAAARATSGTGVDGGVTLIEVVVSMAIMTIVMAIFTGGMLQLYRSANKVESMSNTQSQINTAFLRLDREIRYAAAISQPGHVAAGATAGWYVEYLTTNSGAAQCTQLWLDEPNRQLKMRTWGQGFPPAVGARYVSLVSSVAAPAAASALEWPVDATITLQRLRVQLEITYGSGRTETRTRSDVTFTALNTKIDPSNNTVCAEGRP